jgi:hypothetical protein
VFSLHISTIFGWLILLFPIFFSPEITSYWRLYPLCCGLISYLVQISPGSRCRFILLDMSMCLCCRRRKICFLNTTIVSLYILHNLRYSTHMQSKR